jgi:hypothetical protein
MSPSISRRQLLQGALGAGGAPLATSCSSSPTSADGGAVDRGPVPDTPRRADGPRREASSPTPPPPVVIVALDGLHPGYLSLDRDGYAASAGGSSWLMPNLRAFLQRAVWYPQARDYLPALSDANHLNALAGTNSGQTGIIGVKQQHVGWDSAGDGVTRLTHVSWARDGLGRPVDTLFGAWKRAYPASTTALVSGSQWIGEMYRCKPPIVDEIITGVHYPSHLRLPPREHSLVDPPSDTDAACDPESWLQSHGPAATMMVDPNNFPPTSWIVDAALDLFDRRSPGLTYILLSETDDAQHILGAAWDPAEYVPRFWPYFPPAGCANPPTYQLISRRNGEIVREPILDAMREIDLQVGRLFDGLEQRGVLATATVVVLSDHGLVTHLADSVLAPKTDFRELLRQAKLVHDDDAVVNSAFSVGALFYREGKQRAAAAKKLLEAYQVKNPQTGQDECPWWVLDRAEMKAGRTGVVEAGELYHTFFIDTEQERTTVWPDLSILARSGWQLPVYLPNLPAVATFCGGHGSVDTQPMILAFSRPGGPVKQLPRAARIADLAVTIAALRGLELRSTTVGSDLSADLG